jgi:CelD/BcsL family acetyltransferase involved in cellulose biosynthesis
MRTVVIPAKELSSDLVAAWSDLQRADPNVDSPFFRPEFTQAVAAVRDDVEVAVLEDGGAVVGFFPFQRGKDKIGRPVGGRLSDFQGVVARRDYAIDPPQLLHGCGLRAWYFDHLIAAQGAFAPFHWTGAGSPYIDISRGYDAYVAERRAAGGADVMQAINKKKRSERQLGPVRVVLETTDRGVLEKLIAWKSQQYERTQVTSVFAFPWVVALIERLLETPPTADFGGMLSALYLGDTLVAAHFGMRSGRVVHWWFPAYDAELSKYSPGAQMLLELAGAAASLGCERIDLGAGEEPYKLSFMSGSLAVAIGSVDRRPATRTARRLWHHTKRWVRGSSFRAPASVPWRLIRNLRDQVQFR